MHTHSFHSSERNFIAIRLSAMQRKKERKKKREKTEQSRTEQNFYFPSEKPPCFTKCVLLVTFISLFTLDYSRLFSVLQLTICLCRVLRRDCCGEFFRNPSIRHSVDTSLLCSGRQAFTGCWRTKLTRILSSQAVNQKH